jgi:hypothetical protein
MSAMRKCIIQKWLPTPDAPGRSSWQEAGEALFHQFGVAYEEYDAGPGNYSTAIVELPDGQVLAIPADKIRFIPKFDGSLPFMGE